MPAGEPLGTGLETPAPASVNPAAEVAASAPAQSQASPSAPPSGGVARPGFDLGTLAEPSPAPEPVEQIELADAFADFSLPASENDPAQAQGAVDLASFEPRREKPQPEPEADAEEKARAAHPRRHWVQVATGRDRSALAFDWRRIRRGGGDLLASVDGHIAPWNATHRLLAGPYASAQAAQEAVTQLKAGGIDSFPFTSSAGEEVTPIGGR